MIDTIIIILCGSMVGALPLNIWIYTSEYYERHGLLHKDRWTRNMIIYMSLAWLACLGAMLLTLAI